MIDYPSLTAQGKSLSVPEKRIFVWHFKHLPQQQHISERRVFMTTTAWEVFSVFSALWHWLVSAILPTVLGENVTGTFRLLFWERDLMWARLSVLRKRFDVGTLDLPILRKRFDVGMLDLQLRRRRRKKNASGKLWVCIQVYTYKTLSNMSKTEDDFFLGLIAVKHPATDQAHTSKLPCAHNVVLSHISKPQCGLVSHIQTTMRTQCGLVSHIQTTMCTQCGLVSHIQTTITLWNKFDSQSHIQTSVCDKHDMFLFFLN